MAKSTMVSITGRVERILTDRTRYKNYQPEVSFNDLYVEFLIPAEHVVEREEGGHVITFEGFANHVLDPFCNKIEEMHNAWEDREIERQESKVRAQMKRRD